MHQLPSRDIVLVGAGHTNLHVVRQWARDAVPDTRLTLVSATPYATYSGMLPGTLAGLYQPADMLIDLHRLARGANTRLVVSAAERIDPKTRRVYFADRPPLRFDVASIGVGSVPSGLTSVESHPGLVAIKPMYTFLQRLDSVLQQVSTPEVRIAVAGAGAAGVEVAFCVRSWMHRSGRKCQVQLVDAHERILSGFRDATICIVERELATRGIERLSSRRIVSSEGRTILCSDGTQLECDVLLWCVGAAPPPLLAHTDLPLSSRGFLQVSATLQTVADDPIFAVGDSSEIAGIPLPKAGVYAVRQGPILFRNLCRQLLNRPLSVYRPQRDFLRLLATGDGKAIAQYRGLRGSGKWLWKLKDHIDSKFMRMHRPESNRMLQMDSSMMTEKSRARVKDAQTESLMRCNGCGGKTSPHVLENVLQQLRSAEGIKQSRTFLQSGDAAVLPETAGITDTVSVDFFQSFIDDPWIVGRIAAIHALSDLWAAGTRPTAAVAMVTLPEGRPRQQQQMLEHLLRGAIREFDDAGVVLVGGHTVDGDSLSIGFTVLGESAGQQRFAKAGLQPGDRLLLTKPLGTGTILAAAAQNKTNADTIESALAVMLRSNRSAADLAHQFQATAVTDITGFGLAGHLFEMLDASQRSAVVRLSQLPLIPGTRACFGEGVRSSLDEANRHVANRVVLQDDRWRQSPEFDALFDPQTSGGLLIGVTDARAELLLKALRESGLDAADIGEAIPVAETDGQRLLQLIGDARQ